MATDARKTRTCDANWRMAFLLFWLFAGWRQGGEGRLPAGSRGEIVLRRTQLKCEKRHGCCKWRNSRGIRFVAFSGPRVHTAAGACTRTSILDHPFIIFGADSAGEFFSKSFKSGNNIQLFTFVIS
jgi:hypothetical protein